MKIAQLKKLLADLPDDMEVVVSGSDHSYSKIGRGSSVVKAERWPDGDLNQYYNEVNKSEPNNQVVEVFWIDDGRY